MCADLWSFAVSTYARPGVEDICLRLQTQGADVCLLLCGLWLEQRGICADAMRLQALKHIAQPWQADVIDPLRQLRKQWRATAQHDIELGALRERIKSLEIDAERELLGRLQTQALAWPEERVARRGLWLEELAAEAANLDRDTLHQLRVAAIST